MVVLGPFPGLGEEPTSYLGANGGTYNAEGLCIGPPSSPPGTMKHCSAEGPPGAQGSTFRKNILGLLDHPPGTWTPPSHFYPPQFLFRSAPE